MNSVKSNILFPAWGLLVNCHLNGWPQYLRRHFCNAKVVAGILSKLMIISFHYLLQSVPTRGRGSRYKLPEPGGPEGGPLPDGIACVFVFVISIIICPLYKLNLSAQTKATLKLSQYFRFSVEIFSQPALAGGPRKFIFIGPWTHSQCSWLQSYILLCKSSTFITCVVRCIPPPIEQLSLNRLFMRKEQGILVQPSNSEKKNF